MRFVFAASSPHLSCPSCCCESNHATCGARHLHVLRNKACGVRFDLDARLRPTPRVTKRSNHTEGVSSREADGDVARDGRGKRTCEAEVGRRVKKPFGLPTSWKRRRTTHAAMLTCRWKRMRRGNLDQACPHPIDPTSVVASSHETSNTCPACRTREELRIRTQKERSERNMHASPEVKGRGTTQKFCGAMRTNTRRTVPSPRTVRQQQRCVQPTRPEKGNGFLTR